jgi:hypothetical protein
MKSLVQQECVGVEITRRYNDVVSNEKEIGKRHSTDHEERLYASYLIVCNQLCITRIIETVRKREWFQLRSNTKEKSIGTRTTS